MSEPSAEERAARQRAEHRMIVQATMQAKRSGKLTSRPANTAGEAITALLVVIVVIGLLILAARYGN